MVVSAESELVDFCFGLMMFVVLLVGAVVVVVRGMLEMRVLITALPGRSDLVAYLVLFWGGDVRKSGGSGGGGGGSEDV